MPKLPALTWMIGLPVLAGCAREPALLPAWALDESGGWGVREVEDEAEPSWVLYERDSSLADVKEFRIIGTLEAPPDRVMEATRERLLDEQYLPNGLQREILAETETEIVLYGRMPLPVILRDREATERLLFSSDPQRGVHRMDGREIELDEPPERGVLRIPLARNTIVVEPLGQGSLLTNVSVHNIGGGFPNWVTYGPTRNQLIEDLELVRRLAR